MRPVRFFPAALLFPALLCVIPASRAQETPPTQDQGIHVSVDRVNVGVIVTDSRGNFMEGLRREDFHLFDNAVEQPISDFAAIEEPAQVLLLIEAGPAVYLLEGGHLQAAHSLLNGLSSGDRVAVVKYAESPTALLDFSADKQSSFAALEQLRFNLGFGSLNLSASVSKVLEWLGNTKGKKTIVLLSTGVDTSPMNEPALVIQQLKISDVRLLAHDPVRSLICSSTLGISKVRRKSVTPSSRHMTFFSVPFVPFLQYAAVFGCSARRCAKANSTNCLTSLRPSFFSLIKQRSSLNTFW